MTPATAIGHLMKAKCFRYFYQVIPALEKIRIIFTLLEF